MHKHAKDSMPLQRQLHVGAEAIPYALTFANRKSIGITIRRDQSVDVRAPHGTDPARVDALLQKRARWIIRHRQNFAQMSPASSPAGEVPTSYAYLGQRVKVQVVALQNARVRREQVQLVDGLLTIWIKDTQDPARVMRLLARWRRQQAAILFSQRLNTLLAQNSGFSPHTPELAIRQMRARWGSCSATGKITINVKLLHFAEPLIDYVIMHELCHLIEHNHSSRFYALLTRLMPDWRARRECLNTLGMPD